jgi:hypothetical protein
MLRDITSEYNRSTLLSKSHENPKPYSEEVNFLKTLYCFVCKSKKFWDRMNHSLSPITSKL